MIALAVTHGLVAELYQAWPELNAVPHCAVPVPARQDAQGAEFYPFDEEALYVQLYEARQQGATRIVVSLLHAYHHPAVENRVRAIAQHLGFEEVLLGHAYAGHWLERTAAALAQAGVQVVAQNTLDVETFERQYPVLLLHSGERMGVEQNKVVGVERLLHCLEPALSTELCAVFKAQPVFTLSSTSGYRLCTVQQSLLLAAGERLGVFSST